MYFLEQITNAYTWSKTVYQWGVEKAHHYPAADFFFRGLNESIKLVSFLRPTIATASVLFLKQTKAFFYSMNKQTIELKENASHAIQYEKMSDSTYREEKKPQQLEMKEWTVIPPLTAKTSDSELMDIVFFESFKLNASHLAQVLTYYTVISPLLNPIIRFVYYLQGNTQEEAYANAEEIHYAIDLLASLYFIRNIIDLLVQNQAFAKLIGSIAKKHSPFASHVVTCTEKKEICEHLHPCLCLTSLKDQGDSDSPLYYFTYLTLLSTIEQIVFYIGSGMRATATLLNYFQWTYLPINKLLSLGNLFIKASFFASIGGQLLEILAEGWCIGEYRLSTIGTCSHHRSRHLKENYHYYIGVGVGSFLANTLLNKPLIWITGLTSFYKVFISTPIAAFLFQGYIAIILKKQIILKKTSEDWADVFSYHRLISDAVSKKISSYAILKLNDPKCRNFLSNFEKPFKFLLFMLLKPSLRSPKLLAKKPAINLYFCWEKENIDHYMYWVHIVESLPNAPKQYIAKVVSFAPSWLISESITIIVGWAEKYGIHKLIKQIEEFLTLVQCEHPTMRANEALFYSPLAVKENHSKAIEDKKDIISSVSVHASRSENNAIKTSKNKLENSKNKLNLSRNTLDNFDKKHNTFPVIISQKPISLINKTLQKAPQKKEDNNEDEKWVLVNKITPLQQNSLFTYVSKLLPNTRLPTAAKTLRYFTGYSNLR